MPTLDRSLLLAAFVLAAPLPALAQEQGPDRADASLGTVLDREGTASLRRAAAERWELAAERQGLEPGDWLKTATRGANALKLKFGQGELILGPGALIELIRPGELRLLRGELALLPPEGTTWRAHPPQGKESLALPKRAVLRAGRAALEALKRDPKWLSGYENHASTEAMGSLLAKVDGREVGLTMGYHKVTVDIRDQIARTVVEESFVNHTDHVLEGVFYFPLPGDASISGFSMWIGDEQVHGEIVEKQRARAIYETILREKRDPGLLEWAGGNVFKARVYPIVGEKRIKISYTQVLPKQGASYRYHYALQSEMLRAHPLRRLELSVKVDSQTKLTQVSCPSHGGRLRQTSNNASFEFSADEFTPERDFELRIATESAGAQGRATLVPHVRDGSDGYFLCLVDSPQRDAAPDPMPLDVIVIADTSASVSGSARETQLQLIEALLGNLGAKDRFNLLTADSEARWAFDKARAVDAVGIEEALAFVERRRPLGWSDLDRAFAAAIERAGPNTQVIYLGDGAITTGDADPVAFAARLQERWSGQGHFHAIQPGSQGEGAALRAVAGLGSGSLRAIGGGSDPAAAAAELLREILSPKLEDLEVHFRGFATAAVYPSALPNLPLGTQHVLVGRFQPSQGGLEGKVEVRARIGRELISADTAIEAKTPPGAGNSFVPRLWARRHLDALLEQGRSEATQARVIALSEDFQIITPYTSFLVLESEADRERFNVKKRFRMRDGEDFFAEGRDNADYALRQQQLEAAKKWRVELRAKLLESLSDMNRGLVDLLSREKAGLIRLAAQGEVLETASEVAPGSDAQQGQALGRAKREATRSLGAKNDDGLIMGEGGDLADAEPSRQLPKGSSMDRFSSAPQPQAEAAPASPAPPMEAEADEEAPAALEKRSEAQSELGYADRRAMSGVARSRSPRQRRIQSAAANALAKSGFLPLRDERPPQAWNGLLNLFPRIPAPARPFTPTWEEPARAPLLALDRAGWLAKLGAVLEVKTSGSRTDLRGRERSSGEGLALLGPEAWACRRVHLPGEGTQLSWLQGQERGELVTTWGLGRTRPREEGDAASAPPLVPWFLGAELRSYAGYTASVKTTEGKTIVRLDPPAALNPYPWIRRPSRQPSLELTIDPQRAVVERVRSLSDGRALGEVRFGDFVEVAGAWLPGSMTHHDAQGKAGAVTRYAYRTLSADAAAEAFAALLAPKARGTLIGALPGLDAARQALEGGEARLEDRLVALSPLVAAQKWEEADAQVAALWKAAALKRAGRFALQASYGQVRRRNEELASLLRAEAKALAAQARPAELTQARTLLGWAGGALHRGQETLDFCELLEPVYARQQREPVAYEWEQRALQALSQSGRPEAVFARQKALAARFPTIASAHTAYARALFARGEVDPALSYLAGALAEHAPWTEAEQRSLRGAIAGLLWEDYRYEALVKQLDAWDGAGAEVALDASLANRVLSALVLLDREAEADQRLRAWVKAVVEEGADDERSWARLRGAVSHALGNCQAFHCQWIVPERAALLVQIVDAFASRKPSVFGYDAPAHVDPESVVWQVVSDYRFRRTDEAQELWPRLYGLLERGVEELAAPRLSALAEWLRQVGFQPEEEAKGWESVMKRVFARWEKSDEAEARDLLGALLQRQGGRELNLARVRALLGEAKQPAAQRAYADELVALLRQGPWSEEAEQELRATFLRLGPLESERGEAREVALNDWVTSYHQLNAWRASARAAALLEAEPDRNELDRRQLVTRREALLRKARLALREALGQRGPTLPEPLRAWARLEALWLGVKLRLEAKPLLSESRALLKLAIEQASAAAGSPARDLRWRVAASRACATQIVLLADAPPALRAEARAPFSRLIDQALEKKNELLDWRQLLYSLLLASEELEPLRQRLVAWFGDASEVEDRKWGRALAFLYAERGELEQAVGVLEQLIKELSYAEWQRLADLYVLLDRRADAARAELRSWEQLNEWRLQSGLNSDFYSRYQRRGKKVPEELQADVPVRFQALFRKAQRPERHGHLLRRYYGSTRDFRLLACVPEAALGAGSQRIYSLLNCFRQVTQLLQEEATFDRLQAQLVQLRERARTPVDARAQDLLEFLVAHRAASQNHGVREHPQAALAALARAFERGQWEPGERLLLASFLASQGHLRQPELARFQVAKVRELAAAEEPGSEHHLSLSASLAQLLWSYSQRDEAVRVLEGALAAQRDAEGRLPSSARGAFRAWIGYLEGTGSWRRGEQVLEAERKLARNPGEEQQAQQRLFQLYVKCLRQGGEVSLGREAALYSALLERLAAELPRARNEHLAYQVLNAAVQLIRTRADYREGKRVRRQGREQARRAVAPDAIKLGFAVLPRALNRFRYRNGQNMVGQVSDLIRQVAGPLRAVEFLVTRAESEPRWLRLCGWDFWSQQGWRLTRAKREAGALTGALRTRALAIVVDALGEELREGRGRNGSIYRVDHSYFWGSAKADFRQAAERVLDQEGEREVVLLRVAQYLYQGLGERERGVEVLAERHAGGRLGREGRIRLVTWLRQLSRHAEALPLLEALVAERGELRYRLWLVESAHHAGRQPLAAKTLQATIGWLKERQRWREGEIAQVARACLATARLERAGDLFEEAINLHTRSRAGRGVGGSTLARYYGELAQVRSQLGDTIGAVDAAAGAVVSWSRSQRRRRQALAQLSAVLRRSKDLDGYVRHLDAEVVETGLENPLLRKAIGQVYLRRRAYARAIRQLELSVEARANDAEAQRALIAAYDKGGQPERAASQILALARVQGHSPQLYVELGDRYAKAGQAAAAERAYTTVVELQPNEAAAQAALAQVRERQSELDAAALHWRQVVRLRSDEPAGLIGLAKVLLRAGKHADARAQLDRLRRTEWPERFDKTVERAIRELERYLPKRAEAGEDF